MNNTSSSITATNERESVNQSSRPLWLRWGFRLLAVVMGGLHAWAAAVSHSMNPDGINYLDIGDAYFRGDWTTAVSTVWSPLYSWLTGAVLWLIKPDMRWEFPLIHALNFLIFLAALAAFEFIWEQVRPSRRQMAEIGWPDWAWWSIGYLLFLWAALSLIQIWAVTPDMLMAALLFVAAGLLARIRAGQDGWRAFALLGFILGLGYLSKSIMMPVSLVILAASFVAVADRRRAWPRPGVAILCFLLVTGPFILLMSATKGYFTYGEAGRLTYARHVNGVTYPHWQGIPEGDGVPTHPSRQIFAAPPIYEFATPIGGTYPIAHDQTYWYDGLVVRFDWGDQLRTLLASAIYYADLFWVQQTAVLFGVALLYLARGWRRPSFTAFIRGGLLTGVGLAGLLLYAPILVAGRYVGAFVVLFWVDLLANASLPRSPLAGRVIQSAALLMAAFLFVSLILFNLQGFGDLTRNSAPETAVARPPSWPGATAEALAELGIVQGDPVAVIGYGFDSFWARLARVKIVAEMLGWQADPFWLGDAALQEDVLAAFAAAGAKAIVAEYAPPYANLPGWHQVESSNFFIYLLPEEGS
jgi:hypothetical protein